MSETQVDGLVFSWRASFLSGGAPWDISALMGMEVKKDQRMEQPPCPPPTPTMGEPDNSVQIIFSEVICKNLVTIVPTARGAL